MSRHDIETRFEGKGYGDFKKEVVDVVIETLRPLQTRYYELVENSDYLDSVLQEGASKVRCVADRTLNLVKEKIGLG